MEFVLLFRLVRIITQLCKMRTFGTIGFIKNRKCVLIILKCSSPRVMGNQLLIHSHGSYNDYKDPVLDKNNEERVQFFQSLDMKWIRVFVEKLRLQRSKEEPSSLFRFSHHVGDSSADSKTDELLSWRVYFTAFLEIGESVLHMMGYKSLLNYIRKCRGRVTARFREEKAKQLAPGLPKFCNDTTSGPGNTNISVFFSQ